MTNKKKAIIVSLAAVLLIGGWFAYTKKHPRISYETQKLEKCTITQVVEASGTINPVNTVSVGSTVSGLIKAIYVDYNSQVKKGQLLLTIEPTQYLNALNKAKADLETAKARLYKATRDYERGAELVKKDFISKSTYDSLYADKLSAAAAVKAANSALAEAQRNYGYTSIKSPVDGKIGALNIQEGNYVSTMSGTLATVTKTNPIYVRYSVDSKQFDE